MKQKTQMTSALATGFFIIAVVLVVGLAIFYFFGR